MQTELSSEFASGNLRYVIFLVLRSFTDDIVSTRFTLIR